MISLLVLLILKTYSPKKLTVMFGFAFEKFETTTNGRFVIYVTHILEIQECVILKSAAGLVEDVDHRKFEVGFRLQNFITAKLTQKQAKQ